MSDYKKQLEEANAQYEGFTEESNDLQKTIDEIKESLDKIIRRKSEVDNKRWPLKKEIKRLHKKVEEEGYIYNPSFLYFAKDVRFPKCEWRSANDYVWQTGASIRGYSPDSSASYKIAHKPTSRWAREVRITKDEWAEYLKDVADSIEKNLPKTFMAEGRW